MTTDWFRPRKYLHFDVPVGERFARKVMSPPFVVRHSFSPLIKYTKEEKRYKRLSDGTRKICIKPRDIMYASHRDSAILSYYSYLLSSKLDIAYKHLGISDHPIAYRALGKANYDFAAEAYEYAKIHEIVCIMAFDIKGFFDNLDHRIIKDKLKWILNKNELPDDWYAVYRALTRYRYVESEDLAAHPDFGNSIVNRRKGLIAPISAIKREGLKFNKGKTKGKGIPQGTPISASISNLYMIDFDKKLSEAADKCGSMYMRYSDDILIIFRPEESAVFIDLIKILIRDHALNIQDEKTEIVPFHGFSSKVSQYLGFSFYRDAPGIRPSSLARQWRKMRRSLARLRKAVEASKGRGKENKVYTKSIRRKYSPTFNAKSGAPIRNFSSYGRRSAKAFRDSQRIKAQLRRLESAFEDGLKRIENS